MKTEKTMIMTKGDFCEYVRCTACPFDKGSNCIMHCWNYSDNRKVKITMIAEEVNENDCN